MIAVVVFLGESFRVGGQNSRDRGRPEAHAGQEMASRSHARFLAALRSRLAVECRVVVDSYSTRYDDELVSWYGGPPAVTSYFHPDVVGLPALFEHAAGLAQQVVSGCSSEVAFVQFVRIDLFLKDFFIDGFQPSPCIRYPSICFTYNGSHEVTPGGHPRVSDTMVYVPRRLFRVLFGGRINLLCHDAFKLLRESPHGITDADIAFTVRTYHDSDSGKDWNPMYRMVGRAECGQWFDRGRTAPCQADCDLSDYAA